MANGQQTNPANNYGNTYRNVLNVNVPAGVPTDFPFKDTRPNYIIITNNSTSANMYASTTGTASANNYEIQIPANSQRMIAHPTGVDRISMFSANGTTVGIVSFVGDFSPTAIAQAVTLNNGGSGGGSGGGGTASSVSINAFNAPLPSGSNNIGHVNVDTLPNVTLASGLPAGTNVIGHVNVDSLPVLPAGTNMIGHVVMDSGAITSPLPAGTNNIGQVTVANPSLSSIADVGVAGNSQVSVTGGATAVQIIVPTGTRNFSIKNIDSTNTVYVGHDNTVTASTGYPVDPKGTFGFDVDGSAPAGTVSLWVFAPTTLTVATVAVK